MDRFNDVRNINRWGKKVAKEPIKSASEIVSTLPINMGPRF